MKYSEFHSALRAYSEKNFADFQRRLIPTNYKIIGVRTPILRKLAKGYSADIDDLLSFPDEYYETVFIKLTAVSLLPYEVFVEKLPYCVSIIDNWALCDCFKAKCIKKNKKEFLPILNTLFQQKTECSQRYVLVALLAEYVNREYSIIIEKYIFSAESQLYYVHMAIAWLTAEILIKDFEWGLQILQKGKLPVKTHNKSIQKAIESYRITKQQKEYLRSLKIKQ